MAAFHDCYDATINVSATTDEAISGHATTSNATIPTDNEVPNGINGVLCKEVSENCQEGVEDKIHKREQKVDTEM